MSCWALNKPPVLLPSVHCVQCFYTEILHSCRFAWLNTNKCRCVQHVSTESAEIIKVLELYFDPGTLNRTTSQNQVEKQDSVSPHPCTLLWNLWFPDLLSTPDTSLQTFGDRAFNVAAPTLWSALASGIPSAASLDTFKKLLFTKANGL